TGEAMARLGVTIRPSAEGFTLSGGQRQSAAGARAAMWAKSAIFMGEPTANLGVRQTKGVLDLIRRVRDAGTAVVVISHNLPQILEITERIVILRLGRTVGQVAASAASVDDLVRAMMSGMLHVRHAPEPGRISEHSEPKEGFTTPTELPPDERDGSSMLGRLRSVFSSQSAALFIVLIVGPKLFIEPGTKAFFRLLSVSGPG